MRSKSSCVVNQEDKTASNPYTPRNNNGNITLSDLTIDPTYYQSLFSNWTDNNEALPDFPIDPRESLVALHFIMMAFEEGIDYLEEDINEGIRDRNLFAIDHVQIRLNLVNRGFLSQTGQGRGVLYRSSKSFLDRADWDPRIPGVS